MLNKRKKHQGFTLIELLAVIVVLAIILIIAVPNIIKRIDEAREKAYFISVSNIIDSIKTENVLEEQDYCLYDYKRDTENQTENIDDLNILAHMEEGKIIYSVFAQKEGIQTINTYDFSKLNVDKKSEWFEQIGDKSSYTSYLIEVLHNYSIGNNEEDTIIDKIEYCGVN